MLHETKHRRRVRQFSPQLKLTRTAEEPSWGDITQRDCEDQRPYSVVRGTCSGRIGVPNACTSHRSSSGRQTRVSIAATMTGCLSRTWYCLRDAAQDLEVADVRRALGRVRHGSVATVADGQEHLASRREVAPGLPRFGSDQVRKKYLAMLHQIRKRITECHRHGDRVPRTRRRERAGRFGIGNHPAPLRGRLVVRWQGLRHAVHGMTQRTVYDWGDRNGDMIGRVAPATTGP